MIVKNKDGKNINIPIVTALPSPLNKLFRRADDTKPLFISSLIDYRNLMPIFPELMEILSWKLVSYTRRNTHIDNKNIMISSYAVAKNIDIPE